jgi:hypothetical protein
MTVRNHLIATESLVLRGLVSPLLERLGDHLRQAQRQFITLTDAEVRDLASDRIGAPGPARVGVEAIVWAHEFVALTGDEFRRRHHEAGDDHPVVITMDRPQGLVIAGWHADAWPKDASFFVVRRPRPEGRTPLAAKHAELIAPLPYLLLSRKAAAVIVTDS